jgi:hypothetical protein
MGDVQTAASGEEERREEDQMDVNNGDEEPAGENAEELLRKADKLLASPSTHKDPNLNNDSSPKTRNTSVSSLVGNLTLTRSQIPGVLYPTVGEKIFMTRRQTDLPPQSSNGYGIGGVTGVFFGAGTGNGASTCAETGTGDKPDCVGKNVNSKLPTQKRHRTDTSTDMSTKSNYGFPPVYHNVRKTREKANPYVELPTIEGETGEKWQQAQNREPDLMCRAMIGSLRYQTFTSHLSKKT